MPRLLFIAMAFLIGLHLTSAAWAVEVSVGSSGDSYLSSDANDGSPDNALSEISSFPASGSETAAAGGSSAAHTYDLSNAALSIEFEHVRGANPQSFGAIFADIFFVPDSNVDYLISGQYVAVDPDGSSIMFEVGLTDTTTSQPLFHNAQYSDFTPNESLVLGGTGGDSLNSLSGSLTGTLLAGHEYRLAVLGQVFTPGSAAPATASGFVALTFVPEPGTAALLGLGLAALSRARRNGRSSR